MVQEGTRANEVLRAKNGDTHHAKAAQRTIRADLALTVDRNLVHGSDGPETAANEIALFFREDELLQYPLDTERWLWVTPK
jgi:nucleoside-diphosphate kinase